MYVHVRMGSKHRTERVDMPSLRDHLSEALDSADDEDAKYHVREAYQKVVILEDEGE